jgi:hypothetical protein
VKKTHDYIHRYRGYWSDGGRCRIRIYRYESPKLTERPPLASVLC